MGLERLKRLPKEQEGMFIEGNVFKTIVPVSKEFTLDTTAQVAAQATTQATAQAEMQAKFLKDRQVPIRNTIQDQWTKNNDR